MQFASCPDEIQAIAEKVSVYARVAPKHKLQLIKALQNKGHVVAMTGDSLQYTGNERSWPFTEKAEAIPRGHLPADADHNGGQVFMSTLLKRVEESGADIRVDAKIIQLIQDSNGHVRGCVGCLPATLCHRGRDRQRVTNRPRR